MASGRIIALVVAGAITLAACGVDPGVTAQRADQLGSDPAVVDPDLPMTDPAAPTDSTPVSPPDNSPPQERDGIRFRCT